MILAGLLIHTSRALSKTDQTTTSVLLSFCVLTLNQKYLRMIFPNFDFLIVFIVMTLYVSVQSAHLVFIEWWMFYSPEMYFTQFTHSFI